MYAKRIIPCLDVKNGRVVKGVSFVDLVDAGDPVACAAAYDAQGADELVLLDITATHEGRGTMTEIVRRVAETVFIPFTVGGGIASVEDFTRLLRAGADKISVNSAAVRDPELISKASAKFGAQCVVCAIDAKRRDQGWEVYLNGGRIPTGLDAVAWAKEAERRGAGEILLTFYGLRRSKDRLRLGADSGGQRGRGRAGDCQRRRRQGEALFRRLYRR